MFQNMGTQLLMTWRCRKTPMRALKSQNSCFPDSQNRAIFSYFDCPKNTNFAILRDASGFFGISMSSKVESLYSGTFLFFEFWKNLTNSRKYAKTAYIFLFFSVLKEFLNKSKMMLHYLNDSSVTSSNAVFFPAFLKSRALDGE